MTQGQSQGRLLTIQKFADICRTTLKTLRIYEREDLLKPFKVDKWNNYRYYLPKQSEDFMRIKLLQSFDLSLEQIKGLMRKQPKNLPITQELEKLAKEISEKKKKYDFLKDISEFLFQKVDLSSDLVEENIKPLNLFCLKVQKGEYSKIASYFDQQLWPQAKTQGIRGKYEVLLYLDTEYSPKNANLEVCLTYTKKPAKLNLPEGYCFKTTSKAKALAYIYKGPYPYLRLVYQKLFGYFDSQKIKIKNPIFEIYEKGPAEVSSEYNYRTKLVFPLD